MMLASIRIPTSPPPPPQLANAILRLHGQSLTCLVPELPQGPGAKEAGFLRQLRIIAVQDVAKKDRSAVLEAFMPLITWLKRCKEHGSPCKRSTSRTA
jgi:hypothetical protein